MQSNYNDGEVNHNHFARIKHDNNTPEPYNYGSVYYDNFRRSIYDNRDITAANDDLKHNRTAWTYNECPACDNDHDFRNNHFDNGTLNNHNRPDHGIDPGDHGC